MKTKSTSARRGALWGGLGALSCAAMVLAAETPAPPKVDTATSGKASHGQAASPYVPSRTSGNEGGVAGAPVLLFDNGPLITGAAGVTVPAPCTAADISILQSNSGAGTPPGLCLNTNGYGLTGALFVADDFTLNDCARIQRVTVYAYLTGATTVGITGAQVRLHSGQPTSVDNSVIAASSVLAGPASFTNTYRMSQGAPGCTRRIQQVTVDTSAWPDLPSGTYWLSWNVTGASFCPPVTILGQPGKPGANSMQNSGTNGAYAALVDAGAAGCIPAPPNPNPQDMPFRLEGEVLSPCGACPANIVTSGSSATTVDIDDLLAVISAWGPCHAPPTPCPANIVTSGSSATTVDIDDLLAVISAWGPCPPGIPVPPVLTGACCTPVTGVCSNGPADTCNNGGGIFQGFGTSCATISCPTAPPNDEPAGAIAISTGNTAVDNTGSTTTMGYPGSPGGPASACASLTNNCQNDLWYSFQTSAGITYTVDTLLTPDPNTDTYLQYFDVGGTTELNCNDDVGGGPLTSTMQLFGDGTIKHIRIGLWGASSGAAGYANDIVMRITAN